MSSTTRSRQTFQYRSDDTNDDENNGSSHILDETEQETLIQSLTTHTQRTDAQYVRAFTSLPLLATPAFVFFCLRPSSSPPVRFICVMALTSLVASSLNMYLTPVDDEGQARSRSGRAGVLQLPFDLGQLDSDGPLGRVLPFLNPALAVLLVISSWGMRRREVLAREAPADAGGRAEAVPGGFWMFCLVPPLVMLVVWYTKRSMGEVRQGIGELRGLRYGLKGA